MKLIFSIKEDNKIGYILQVDFEYCKELHDVHNDYPLCLEHISVKCDMLSNTVKVFLINTILKLVMLKN